MTHLRTCQPVEMSKPRTFNLVEADKAQTEYCKTHELPKLAPYDGRCPGCGVSIYRDISVEEAGSMLVTGCRNCNYSFID